jgi:hypothetical protein
MRLAGFLVALSIGLLLSGILVAIIKPRVYVSESKTIFRVPGGQALLYLVSPSASMSSISVDVRAGSSARVYLASMDISMLAKGAAAILTGMLQSIGTSGVLLDADMASRVLGMRGVTIISSGGPGRYVVRGVERPVVLVVYPGPGGGDVYLHVVRYNGVVQAMNEKRMGIAASIIAAVSLTLILRDMRASR